MKEFYKEVPILILRDIVPLPDQDLTIEVKRDRSKAVAQRMRVKLTCIEEGLDTVSTDDLYVGLFMQKDASSADPAPSEVYDIGGIGRVLRVYKNDNDNLVMRVRVVDRGKRLSMEGDEYWSGLVASQPLIMRLEDISEQEREALYESIRDERAHMLRLAGVSDRTAMSAPATDLASLMNQVIRMPFCRPPMQQIYLEENNETKRALIVLQFLKDRTQVETLRQELNQKVKASIDKNQKEFFIREQIRALKKEVGDDEEAQMSELEQKIAELDAPEEVLEKLKKEMNRMGSMPPGSQEKAVIQTYLETMLELPWNKSGEVFSDIKRVEEVLEADHYGLEKVKERILDYLAVYLLSEKVQGTLICLVGPPGCGKTSVATSIARALRRAFVRISLGGVRDEAEIRGHRKTYVGAMPGRIANAMKQAGVNNPLILLDEIDKMSKDLHGDPASAMLEVLDYEQNHAFRDHYLEVPMDLSKVMFIATANDASNIPAPLYDRMEIIELSGYTENEKLHIAKDYLVKKQVEKNGLAPGQVTLPDETLLVMIREYTREAGVRALERRIGEICRKYARKLLEMEDRSAVFDVTPDEARALLGRGRTDDKGELVPQIGVVHGLAWTGAGGDTLDIEVNVMPGKGELKLTGKLGDVMKESAMTALSYVRFVAPDYDVAPDFFETHDIHVHVPEGAVPKDGPSAGITLATAILSAVILREVRGDVAMTGEVTLRGRVLPIGGLKEKLLAAKMAGMTTVLVPDRNRPDVAELSGEIVDGLDICYVNAMNDVLASAFMQ